MNVVFTDIRALSFYIAKGLIKYIPEHFQQQDWQSALDIMSRHSFAQLISVQADSALQISHIPVLYDVDNHQLIFHLAAANPHNNGLQDCTSTLIFNGPHGYISPNWADQLQVPTWNYAAVHIKGEIVEETETTVKMAAMAKLADYYEQPLQPAWDMSQLTEKLSTGLLSAIRCYRMRIDHWQAKIKLSQNRSPIAVKQVAANLLLKNYPNQDNLALSELMLRNLPRA